MDHATRPYYCPACRDTYPGRAAYLSHPCIARLLPTFPLLADVEEPDRAIERLANDGMAMLLRVRAEFEARLPALLAACEQFATGVRLFYAAVAEANPQLWPAITATTGAVATKQRARERALRRSRRNTAAPARRAARR
jgi:hypothetical protein